MAPREVMFSTRRSVVPSPVVKWKDRPKPTDDEVEAMWRANPGITLGRMQILTRRLVEDVSRVLKSRGITTSAQASGGREDEDADVNQLSDCEWGFVAGVLFSQKTPVYVTRGNTRIIVTNSRPERLEQLKDLLGVGEVNCFRTNQGKNTQWVYRAGKAQHVKAILLEVRARLPGVDESVEKGLAALDGKEEAAEAKEAEEEYKAAPWNYQHDQAGTPIRDDRGFPLLEVK